MITINRVSLIVSLSIFIIFSLTSCAVIQKRNPVPNEALGSAVQIPGIPQARIWGDKDPAYLQTWTRRSRQDLMKEYPGIMGRRHNYLAISGGGADGAYGAGLLVGWSDAGTRPEFTMVSGVSTGALAAPFAFLGPAYDGQLRGVFTTYSTSDLVVRRNLLSMLTGHSVFDTKPLEKVIAKYVDQSVMEAIAVEFRKGRRLWIATTNLDAERSVIWNIGAIANSGAPGALELIHKVMLASASIPGAFPPVIIEVEANGNLYDEMHVDGGTVSQIFVTPSNVKWNVVARNFDIKGTPRLFLIRNSSFDPHWEATNQKIRNIAGKSITLLIKTQGIGDIYRIYAASKLNGMDRVDFNLASIPGDFDVESSESFDPVYMQKLFDLGYRQAKEGYPWAKKPPAFE